MRSGARANIVGDEPFAVLLPDMVTKPGARGGRCLAQCVEAYDEARRQHHRGRGSRAGGDAPVRHRGGRRGRRPRVRDHRHGREAEAGNGAVEPDHLRALHPPAGDFPDPRTGRQGRRRRDPADRRHDPARSQTERFTACGSTATPTTAARSSASSPPISPSRSAATTSRRDSKTNCASSASSARPTERRSPGRLPVLPDAAAVVRSRMIHEQASAVLSALRTLDIERRGLDALEAAMRGTAAGGLGAAFSRAVETIAAASGRVIVTGMGKSGHRRAQDRGDAGLDRSAGVLRPCRRGEPWRSRHGAERRRRARALLVGRDGRTRGDRHLRQALRHSADRDDCAARTARSAARRTSA